MTDLPSSAKYVILGAGIHGFSTGWHLAMELESRDRGSGADIIVLDKTGVGAGASGIACGCVRNLYMTGRCTPSCAIAWTCGVRPGRASASSRWATSGAAEGKELAGVREASTRSQNAAGYPSDLYVGDDAKRSSRASGPTSTPTTSTSPCTRSVSGYAGTRQAVDGLAQKCADHGVRIIHRRRSDWVTMSGGGEVKAVHTNQGDMQVRPGDLGPGRLDPQALEHARRPRHRGLPVPRRRHAKQGHVDLLAAAGRRGLSTTGLT